MVQLLKQFQHKFGPGDASVHVSIVNWIKGNAKERKRLEFQCGDSINDRFRYHELPFINSSLSLAVNLSNANKLHSNKTPKYCYQGQTHGHSGFLLNASDALDILNKDHKLSDVLFPFLTADDLLSVKGGLPKRYVIDFRKHDVFSAQEYNNLFDVIKKEVQPTREAKAKQEEERNKKSLLDNPNRKVNHHHENFYKKWWKLSYTRDALMNTLERIPRYCACGQVTKRPIFEFIHSDIHPNAALVVFTLYDDYSFGILQSIVHWEWFTARCSTLKGDFRYTSSSVFDSFPWPQKPSLSAIEQVSKYAVALRKTRRNLMLKHNLSFRDLYRIVEETPSNSVTLAQDRLDEAVRKAYGIKRKDDILAFLLELNHELYKKESNNESITGPGLPKSVTNPNHFVTDDCIQMTNP